jgi:hypothetical protein
LARIRYDPFRVPVRASLVMAVLVTAIQSHGPRAAR